MHQGADLSYHLLMRQFSLEDIAYLRMTNRKYGSPSKDASAVGPKLCVLLSYSSLAASVSQCGRLTIRLSLYLTRLIGLGTLFVPEEINRSSSILPADKMSPVALEPPAAMPFHQSGISSLSRLQLSPTASSSLNNLRSESSPSSYSAPDSLHAALHRAGAFSAPDREASDHDGIINSNSNGDANTSSLHCANCNTTKTPLWRRDADGKLICNACGKCCSFFHFMIPVVQHVGMI